MKNVLNLERVSFLVTFVNLPTPMNKPLVIKFITSPRGGLAFFFLGGTLAQQWPVWGGQTVVWCGHFEKSKFIAIIIGDTMV